MLRGCWGRLTGYGLNISQHWWLNKCWDRLIGPLWIHIYFLFSRFVEDGANFSINSDDPLICQTRMDLEQGVAFNKIGLSPADLTRAVCCISKRFVFLWAVSIYAIVKKKRNYRIWLITTNKMNQSKREGRTCNGCQAREICKRRQTRGNTRKPSHVGFGFASDWLKKKSTSGQSQQTQWTSQNSKQKHATGARCGKTHVKCWFWIC